MNERFPIDWNYLQTQKVAFSPQTEDEALRIQKKLALAGVRWADGDRVGACLSDCVKSGMWIKGGVLFTNSPEEKTSKYKRPAEDILSIPDEDLMSTEARLYAMLRAQAAEITQLHRKIDRLIKAVVPRPMDKRLLLGKPPRAIR